MGDGWIEMGAAVSHLGINLPNHLLTESCIVQAVRLSDREDGRVPRFELYISGSNTWIRATEGELYRARAHS